MLLNFCCVTHLYILNFIELTKTTEYRLKRDSQASLEAKYW